VFILNGVTGTLDVEIITEDIKTIPSLDNYAFSRNEHRKQYNEYLEC